jgi:purine-binding chemotaxis protein CheW
MESKQTSSDDAAPSSLPTARWVVFVCSAQRFGVPLASVREILTPWPFTRLPGAGRGVCGLVGVRGSVVVAFDAGMVFGLEPAARGADHRLLLIEPGGRRTGLAVESVAAIATATPDLRGGVPPGRMAAVVQGTANLEDSAFVALDPEALITTLLN